MGSTSRGCDVHDVEQAVRRFQRGHDPDRAFRTLFDCFYARLLGYFRKHAPREPTPEDLVQQTFLAAYRGLPGFRGRVPFEFWLFGLAANELRQALRYGHAAKRRAQVEPISEARTPADHYPDPLRSAIARQRLSTIERRLAGLPDQMRRCLALRLYEDLDDRSIADILQIAPATVKVHLHRARRRLAEDRSGETNHRSTRLVPRTGSK